MIPQQILYISVNSICWIHISPKILTAKGQVWSDVSCGSNTNGRSLTSNDRKEIFMANPVLGGSVCSRTLAVALVAASFLPEHVCCAAVAIVLRYHSGVGGRQYSTLCGGGCYHLKGGAFQKITRRLGSPR